VYSDLFNPGYASRRGTLTWVLIQAHKEEAWGQTQYQVKPGQVNLIWF